MTLHVRSNIKQRRIFTRKHTQTQGIYPKTMNNECNTDYIYMMDTYIYILFEHDIRPLDHGLILPLHGPVFGVILRRIMGWDLDRDR